MLWAEDKKCTSNLYFPGMTFWKRNSLLLSVKLTVLLSSFRLPAKPTRVTETEAPHFSLQATVPRTLTNALIVQKEGGKKGRIRKKYLSDKLNIYHKQASKIIRIYCWLDFGVHNHIICSNKLLGNEITRPPTKSSWCQDIVLWQKHICMRKHWRPNDRENKSNYIL